jgi:hypothetical protein
MHASVTDTPIEDTQTVENTRYLRVRIAAFEFKARFEEDLAPLTCSAFSKLMPLKARVIHCRWSGLSGWVPMGNFSLGVGYENNTSHPAPGEILYYPAGLSQTEILLPYGGCAFSSHVGQLSGNHFLTIVEGKEQLSEYGRMILWEGAQDIAFEDL